VTLLAAELRSGTAPCLVGLFLALALGCTPSGFPPSDAAARIDGDEIPYQQFETYLGNNVGSEKSSLAPQTLAKLFEKFLDEELLVRAAVEAGAVPRELPRREAIRKVLSEASIVQISDEEVAAFYQANRQHFERPERVRLRQILVAERAEAEEALEALRAGEAFADVARRLSIDPNAHRGGDQGELAEADLPPAFVEPVFGLRAGEISPIVEAEYGYHIFQVVERRGGALDSLAESEDEIRTILQQQRADEAMARLLEEARSRYNVLVYGRNLPFEYRGAYRVAKSSQS
jgi:PPIC-type PPIASE domain